MALIMEDMSPSGAAELIAGRYRVESRIAKGGMGAVYRVFDQVQNRVVALKRLREGDDRRELRMFEREFYTLAGLKHPRIIEVFDYGIDAQGAYYTMELLDGRDLRELAPLPFETACRYLRDVAASLALLHARSLLHRDLSPRNVRITSDGRAKLIDFGALTGFGKSSTIVGTPPFVAPEALDGAPLDQRTDLYSLGALAYWVLTGAHAYDVRAIADLPEALAKLPPPPSALVANRADLPSIPTPLDELVLALLSRNPLARPSCAAEVIARLSAIAGLPPDKEPLSALSYLHGGASVGRARERARLRRRVKAVLEGSGAAVLIEAEAGMGTARLLSELATEARLLGMTAALADAEQHAGSYGVVEAIAHAIVAAHPEKARAAMAGHAAELSRFVPDAASPRPAPARAARARPKADPVETRMRTQAALLAFIARLAQDVPLLLCVRNFHAADDSSAALLAALAASVSQHRVLLVVTVDPDERVAFGAAHAALRELATRIRLRGLSRDEVRLLVESTFGEVPNTERLAGWLHELTQGKPQACLDLLQHLIEHDVIRFSEGVWSLPQELAAHELPASLGQALDARFDRLSDEARRLALALSVERGAIPIDRALRLAELERIASPFRALTELEQRGVLVAGDDTLRFTHKVVRDAALQRIPEPERKRLHAQLGALIAKEGGSDASARLDAGWHLLHGGEERRGAELLAKAGLELSQQADSMPLAIPALEAALAAYRQQRRGRLEVAILAAALTVSGFYTDRRVIERYGDQAIALLGDVLGLGLARRLRSLLGARLGLMCGMAVGLLRCMRSHGPLRAARAYRNYVTLYITCVGVLTGLAALTLDAPRARRYALLHDVFEPFGADHGTVFNGRFTRALALVPEDRIATALSACREVLARLEAPEHIPDLPAGPRAMMLAAALYTVGALETFREDPIALRIADRLENMGGGNHKLYADQIRANYHGLRGEAGLAEHFIRRVELFAMQAGASWQAEIWTACSAILWYTLTKDLVGLKRVAGELDRLSKDIPSLRGHALLARAAYHAEQGQAAEAYEIAHPVFTAAEPRGFIGWTPTVAAQVQNRAALGELGQALQLGLRVLALCDAEDRAVTTMYVPILIEVALVEAQLGRTDDAALRIDEFLAELGGRGGPATRGSLHEARARIALLAGDAALAREHVARMEREFRPTANPALIARCERMRRRLEGGDAETGAEAASAALELGVVDEQARRSLLACATREQRFEAALALLLERTGGLGGALYGYEDGALVLRAAVGHVDPPTELGERLLEAAQREGGSDVLTVSTTAADETAVVGGSARATPGRYCAVLLGARHGARRELVAAAAIALGGPSLRTPPPPLLGALAEALAEPATARTTDDASES